MENSQHDATGVMICSYQADISYPGTKKFDCGNAVINAYVRSSLKKSVKDGNCAARALIDSSTGELLGVCTFCGYSLKREKLVGAMPGSLPGEVAVVRLVMLGVAIKEQKKGYGQDLLCEFLEQVKEIHNVLPQKGVYLDADPEAINFYARLGFVQLDAPANAFGAVPMFMGIQHILAA